uniref:PsbJ n=1 Tax=Campanula rapunculoides TaxID=209536 RepID=A0A2K9RM96_9ASTR|nr:PsbJ [Campanula rapunculoides]
MGLIILLGRIPLWYCNWYSCDRLPRYFLLWCIFLIGLIAVVIV